MGTVPSKTTVAGPPTAEALIDAIVALLRETRQLVCGHERLEEGSVHESRKNLKKIRAGLKLLGDAGGVDLKLANALCRDVGRLLSGLRDTDVCLLTLMTLDPARASANPFAERLRARREALHEADAPDPSSERQIIADLEGVEETLRALDTSRFTGDALAAALQRSRRLGTRRYAALVSAPEAEAFHDLRKAAKRELYQRRLLDGLVQEPDARTQMLEVLGEHLGRHQDLEVLRRVAAELDSLTPALDEAIGTEIGRERRQSLAIAGRAYGSGA